MTQQFHARHYDDDNGDIARRCPFDVVAFDPSPPPLPPPFRLAAASPPPFAPPPFVAAAVVFEPLRRCFLRFFFAVRLSCPLSVFELSLSEPPPSLLLELDDDDDELLELLLESDAKPVLSFKFTAAAICASAGSFSFSTRSHLLDSFGRPRTVLCHTTGKLVLLQKFCVTATVSSRFSTTCHQPPGTKTVSPGRCSISSYPDDGTHKTHGQC